MATWSSKRKFVYAVIAIVIAAVAIVLPAWKIFYTPPSCFDGKQNGDETGVDCGGSCTKVCQDSFLSLPSPEWVRFREVAPGTYNGAAYILNPNPKAGAKNVSYTMDLLDAQGITLSEITGTFDVAPGRNTLVFAGPFKVTTQTPARATIAIGDPVWYVGNDPLPNLSVSSKDYQESTTSSSLDVTLTDTGALAIPGINVYAILYDASSTVVDFSRTIVDGIAPAAKAIAPFSWPYSHSGKVVSIEVLSVPE